jgi:hypothetical protein
MAGGGAPRNPRKQGAHSVTAVYDKLQGVETAVSAELAPDSARQMRPIIRRLPGRTPRLLPGYSIRILDGNHLAGTEHLAGGHIFSTRRMARFWAASCSVNVAFNPHYFRGAKGDIYVHAYIISMHIGNASRFSGHPPRK